MKLITSSKFQFFFFGLISVGWLGCNCTYVRTFVGSKKKKEKEKVLSVAVWICVNLI